MGVKLRQRFPAEPSVRDAFSSPRLLVREILAGLVVALALIPEAISFSIIAGVDPKMGLYSSFIMAMTIAFVGGRPAMITAATGAIALVIAPVARDYGIDYFLATVILAGILQIVLGALGVAKLMRFIPQSVMTGFVNSLAILIFIAQLPHLIDVPAVVYPLVGLGLLILVFLPKITSVVPAPLVAIIIVTAIVVTFSLTVPTVGDQGELPRSLPEMIIPDVPFTWETLQIIFPYALGMALVGLMESLMTAKLVDSVTDTGSNKSQESIGQGIANIASGIFGGMGGCAMIGQTMINVKASGARTRISTFMAGALLLLLIVVLGDLVAMIPMAALIAVMIMVSVGTFEWKSIAPSTLKRLPKSETLVMVVTVVVVVATNNLAIGVIIGVLTAALVFVQEVSSVVEVRRKLEEDHVVYTVHGQLLFASSNELTTLFRYSHDPKRVIIDFSDSHIWDASSVKAIDEILDKYSTYGAHVELRGLNQESEAFYHDLAGQ